MSVVVAMLGPRLGIELPIVFALDELPSRCSAVDTVIASLIVRGRAARDGLM
jgi:hypothetical protein